MVNDDWAIVVGINAYPYLGNLNGPVNDAIDFYDWVASPQGGAVPNGPNDADGFVNPINSSQRSRICRILSTDFPNPPPIRPTLEAIQNAFDHLCNVARARNCNAQGTRLGRRLYLYFSGHGCSPDAAVPEEVALLMANATRQSTGYHISGVRYANWFYQSGYFDEVVLFMDCCREVYPSTPVSVVPYSPVNDTFNLASRKRFYGFAAGWARNAWEKRLPDNTGDVRGVFTYTLLRGLRGAAVEPDGQTITAASLREYLKRTLPQMVTLEEQLANPSRGVDPSVLHCDDVILAKLPPANPFDLEDPRYVTVCLHLPSNSNRLLDNAWSVWWNGSIQVAPLSTSCNLPGYMPADAAPNAPTTPGSPWIWELKLPKGLYKITSGHGMQPAVAKLFEVIDVKGSIDVDV